MTFHRSIQRRIEALYVDGQRVVDDERTAAARARNAADRKAGREPSEPDVVYQASGQIRYASSAGPIEPGDTAETTPALLPDYLRTGWTLVEARHVDDDQDRPVNRYLIEWGG